jgi:hypothetical protein
MDIEETGPVEGEIMPHYSDEHLPIVALLLDATELAETGTYLEAVIPLSQALNRDPVWAMGSILGFMRSGVRALAQCRDETFAETIAEMRKRSAG